MYYLNFLQGTYFKALNQYVWHSSQYSHPHSCGMHRSSSSLLLTQNMLLPFAMKDCCSCPLTCVGFSSLYSCCYSKLGVYTLTFPMNQLLLLSPQISPINLPPCFLSATQMWPHSWPFIVSSSVPILSCFILPEIKIFSK